MINQNQNQGRSRFPQKFWSSYEYLEYVIKVQILIVLERFNKSPTYILIIEPRIGNNICTCNPFSFQNVIFLVSIPGTTPNPTPLKQIGV